MEIKKKNERKNLQRSIVRVSTKFYFVLPSFYFLDDLQFQKQSKSTKASLVRSNLRSPHPLPRPPPLRYYLIHAVGTVSGMM